MSPVANDPFPAQRRGSYAMIREDRLAPLPPKRATFSRSSTSSTVSTISSLSTLVGEETDKSRESGETICRSCISHVSSLPTPSPCQDQVRVQGQDISLEPVLQALKADIAGRMSTISASTSAIPKIIGLLATSDTGCRMYAKATAKACTANGLRFETKEITGEIDFESVKEAIEALNDDLTVHGLIVYFPIFGPQKDDMLRSLISTRIDVEGVHPHNLLISSLFPPSWTEAESSIYPCTPLAAVRILQSLEGIYDVCQPKGKRLAGKVVTIVNRSETVGRPLASMLSNEGATVFSIDVDSIHLYPLLHNPPCDLKLDRGACLALSDIVISAVPSKAYKIPTAEIRPGAVCLNIATGNNFEDNVKDGAGLFVKRLGSVTTLILQLNALILYQRQL